MLSLGGTMYVVPLGVKLRTLYTDEELQGYQIMSVTVSVG